MALDGYGMDLVWLCTAALCAGFIDSIVGGGGLLQTPALLVVLKRFPIATILGTAKIPSMSGTAIAAQQFSRRVTLNKKLISFIAFAAFVGSSLGSYTISRIGSSAFMKPVILVILLGVAAYTYFHKKFGLHSERSISTARQYLIGMAAGLGLGFYDGMIGPGTGTFLILLFVSVYGHDFLHASASAKLVNIATNLASLIFFAGTAHILYRYALPMAIFNIAGSILGSQLAILKGNKFIRVFFLVVIFATILRFGWEVLVGILNFEF
jgi:hypothetical protein